MARKGDGSERHGGSIRVKSRTWGSSFGVMSLSILYYRVIFCRAHNTKINAGQFQDAEEIQVTGGLNG